MITEKKELDEKSFEYWRNEMTTSYAKDKKRINQILSELVNHSKTIEEWLIIRLLIRPLLFRENLNRITYRKIKKIDASFEIWHGIFLTRSYDRPIQKLAIKKMTALAETDSQKAIVVESKKSCCLGRRIKAWYQCIQAACDPKRDE